MSATETQINVNTNLQKQDLNNLNISNLTPLSPEVISRQATINIGTIGHVAHGKSTVVKAISGVQTVRFKNELERNITIKLERLSQKRMLELIESPRLLRQHEEREMARLQHLASVRLRKRNISVDTQLTNRISVASCGHRTPPVRDISTSPSSGYESLNDNASSCSGESTMVLARRFYGFEKAKSSQASTTLTAQSLKRLQKQHQTEQQQIRKRRFSQCGNASSPAAVTTTKRRRSVYVSNAREYVVEYIESLESINGNPVFFVKWLNYPTDQNTWESFDNLRETALLESFIEKQHSLFELIIVKITQEIELEINSNNLSFDKSKLNVRDLDEYEPLLPKTDLILLAQFREARSRNVRDTEKIRKRIIEMLLMKPFYYQRKKQLQDLRAWQDRMNLVESTAPVTIENNVDLEVPDPNFLYIKESISGKGVNICLDPPIGCKCEHVCAPMTKCCARMADSYYAYDKNGRLRIRSGEAIYECNSKCICSADCVNRVIQRGRNNMLCIFKTSNGCGWGVRTEQMIRKGEYVCEYVGEIITSEEANERGKQYDAIGRTYLFDLDYNTAAESVYTVDAAVSGNVSHFINHSCDPNLAVFPFWINNLDINMPRLAFFSLRPIKAGEELTFDYIRNDVEEDNYYQNLSEAEKVTCRCGASNCRKVLF